MPKGTPSMPVIFQHQHLTYAIIEFEFIKTMQVSEDTLIDQVAAAVLWLRRQLVPRCPLGSGPAWHAIFKCEPLPFTGTMALERFLNKD